MSQLSYPLAEMILFLASFFAPPNVSEFQMRGAGAEPVTFHATGEAWTHSESGITFQTEENFLVRSSQRTDLTPYLADLNKNKPFENGRVELDQLTVFQRKYGLEIRHHTDLQKPPTVVEVHYRKHGDAGSGNPTDASSRTPEVEAFADESTRIIAPLPAGTHIEQAIARP